MSHSILTLHTYIDAYKYIVHEDVNWLGCGGHRSVYCWRVNIKYQRKLSLPSHSYYWTPDRDTSYYFFIGLRGKEGIRCRCDERQRVKDWGGSETSISHTRWSGDGRVQGRGKRRVYTCYSDAETYSIYPTGREERGMRPGRARKKPKGPESIVSLV